MWLIKAEILETIENAMASKLEFSAEVIDQFNTEASDPEFSSNVAVIPVQGVLTKSPDIFARFFGGGNTTYSQIINALAVAENDANVTEAILEIDSPGGQVKGLFETIDAINKFSKPLKAVVTGTSASAAYAIAASADSIEATSKASEFGSIGILVSMRVREDVVDITSSNAPKKSPDPTTKQGKKDIVARLDSLENLFIGAIATGRNTTPEKVKADFGQGGVFLAEEALNRGMIDNIKSSNVETTPKATAKGVINSKGSKMDIEKLKSEHPSVYKEAVAVGQKMELDRVSAHLTMGEASGAMDVAVKAIENGDELSAKFQAKYMAAGMNKQDVDNRQKDDEAVTNVDGGAPEATEQSDGDVVAGKVLELMGKGEDNE